jgi:hypothetical protein
MVESSAQLARSARRRRIGAAALLILLAIPGLAAAEPNDTGDGADPRPYCANEGNSVPPDFVLRACNFMIDSKQITGNELSGSYYHRGVNYLKLGDFDQTLTDFRDAVRIDPTNARAFEMLCAGAVVVQKDDGWMIYCDALATWCSTWSNACGSAAPAWRSSQAAGGRRAARMSST